MRRLRLVLAALLAIAAGLPHAAPAIAQGAAEVATRRLLDLERRLLAEDLGELQAARAAEADAALLLDGLIGSLGEAVAAGSPAASLAALEASVAEAAAALSAAAERVDGALSTVGERLRRVRVLAAGAAAGGETAAADALTGRWYVEVEPVDVTGELQLDQAGTLVSGSYAFTDGSRGSLEGTLVGGLLRLRRIDVVSGFDSVFEARVNPAAGVMEGRWQATVLGRGGAGGGEWTARRVPEGAEVLAVDEGEAGPDDLIPAGPDPATVAGPDPTTPAGTEDSPPAGPVDEPPFTEPAEEEPLPAEPVEEPPAEEDDTADDAADEEPPAARPRDSQEEL